MPLPWKGAKSEEFERTNRVWQVDWGGVGKKIVLKFSY